jgi:hypothetical protein
VRLKQSLPYSWPQQLYMGNGSDLTANMLYQCVADEVRACVGRRQEVIREGLAVRNGRE